MCKTHHFFCLLGSNRCWVCGSGRTRLTEAYGPRSIQSIVQSQRQIEQLTSWSANRTYLDTGSRKIATEGIGLNIHALTTWVISLITTICTHQYIRKCCFNLNGKWSVQPLMAAQRLCAHQSQKPGFVQQSLFLFASILQTSCRSTAVMEVPPHFGIWMKWRSCVLFASCNIGIVGYFVENVICFADDRGIDDELKGVFNSVNCLMSRPLFATSRLLLNLKRSSVRTIATTIPLKHTANMQQLQ